MAWRFVSLLRYPNDLIWVIRKVSMLGEIKLLFSPTCVAGPLAISRYPLGILRREIALRRRGEGFSPAR